MDRETLNDVREVATSWWARGMMVTGGHALVSFMALNEIAVNGLSNGIIICWTVSFAMQQTFVARLGHEADYGNN